MATFEPLRRKRKLNNFDFALGMGTNWIDMDHGLMYMIQEYKEKMDDPTIPADKKPKKIRIMKTDGETYIGEAEPEIIRERMKDPEPDPRYTAETPEEHRRSMK